jgi:hypothetical protein
LLRARKTLLVGLLLVAGTIIVVRAYEHRGEEVIDTLSFFVSHHPEAALTGDAFDASDAGARPHTLSQTVEGNTSYSVKWHPNAYELHSWDDEYIYLKEDHTFTDAAQDNRAEPYGMKPGVWMKRRMKVGEVLDMGTNRRRILFGDDCQPGPWTPLSYKVSLEGHFPHFDAGGDLGMQDVIVLRYDYSRWTGLPDRQGFNGYEKFYYSKEWGWFQWEYFQDDNLARNPPPLKKWVRCNRKTAQKLQPNLNGTCNRARFVQATLDGNPMPTSFLVQSSQAPDMVIELQNTGNSTWTTTPDVIFRLGLVGDDPRWDGRIPLPAGKAVAPGETVGFHFKLHPPSAGGRYRLQWRMLVEGAEWFGERTPAFDVLVHPATGRAPSALVGG